MQKSVFGVSVSKFKLDSGMQVVFVDAEIACVHGYFSFQTEEKDLDYGVPHTLEHLIFLGSKLYPYKGVLDKLANLSYASGTNAYTDVDHTVYTVSTCSQSGFLNILPCYLNHLFEPLLLESGFITEVYHINELGQDSGVVFNEMQAIENSSSNLCIRRLLQAMYPNSAYSSETGGLTSKLRSLTLEQIKDFHKKYYTPANMSLVIVGKTNHQDVLKLLNYKGTKPNTFEDEIKDIKTTEIHIQFPSEDEEVGTVCLGFLGPLISMEKRYSLEFLFSYLCEGPLSVLNRELVEIEDAYCSCVSFHVMEFKRTSFIIEFEGVPNDKIQKIGSLALELIKNHEIDLERMNYIIQQLKDKLKDDAETDPSSFFSQHAILETLYDVNVFEYLQKDISHNWEELKQIFATHVMVMASPSSELANQMEQQKKEREESRKPYQKYENKLQDAIKNNVLVPDEFMNKFKIPDFNVSWINVETKLLNQVTYSIVSSNMVCCYLIFDLSNVDLSHMELFKELFFNSGTQNRSYDEVMQQLESKFLDYSASVGTSNQQFSCGSFESTFVVYFKSLKSQFQSNLELVFELIEHINFDRASIQAKKLKKDLSLLKRDEEKMCLELMNNSLFPQSIYETLSTKNQQKFLKEFDEKQLYQIKNELFQPKNLQIAIGGNIEPQNLSCSVINKLQLQMQKTESRILSSKAFESGCMSCVASCDPKEDLPALLVLMELLNAMEGIYWQCIRGPGLAYGFQIHLDLNKKLIIFDCYRSIDVVKVFKAAKNCILDFKEISSAKSSLTYSFVHKLDSPLSAASASILNVCFKNKPANYEQILVNQIQKVTMEMVNSAKKYITTFFEECTVFCCVPSKKMEVISEFKKIGINMI